jgi:hypothetical protein
MTCLRRCANGRTSQLSANFFGGTSGEAHAGPLAAPPARSRADQGTCRSVVLIADRRDLDRNTSRGQTEITRRHFQLPTGPCARAPWPPAPRSRRCNDRPPGMRGVSARSWPKVCALWVHDASAGRGPTTVSRPGGPGGAKRAVRASDVADWHTDFRC